MNRMVRHTFGANAVDVVPPRCAKCGTAVRPGMNDPCKCTRKPTRRMAFRDAVAWLALNDSTQETLDLLAAGDRAQALSDVQSFTTTLLVADIYRKEPEHVAEQVVRYLEKHEARTAPEQE